MEPLHWTSSVLQILPDTFLVYGTTQSQTQNQLYGLLTKNPPLDSPGVFMLSGDGNLVVLDGMTRKVVIYGHLVRQYRLLQ